MMHAYLDAQKYIFEIEINATVNMSTHRYYIYSYGFRNPDQAGTLKLDGVRLSHGGDKKVFNNHAKILNFFA